MKAISCLLIAFLLQTCMLSAQSLLPEVNLFLGTSGDHGQLAPAANVPFGMVQVYQDSQPRQHAGYDYAVPTISGISVNRLSGVGGQGCGGNLSPILLGWTSASSNRRKRHSRDIITQS